MVTIDVRRSLVSILLIFLYACIAMNVHLACNSATSPSSSDAIQVSPATLSLTNKTSGYVWMLLGNPKPYSWMIKSRPKWLDLYGTQEVGSSTGSPVKLSFVGNLPLDSSYTVEGDVVVEVVGLTSKTIHVVLAINDAPKMTLSNDSTVLYTNQGYTIVSVKNVGGGVLRWRQTHSANLIVDLDSASTISGAFTTVQVRAVSTLPTGTYRESVVFTAGAESKTFGVTLVVSEQLGFNISTKLKIPYEVNDTTLSIINTGNGDLSWSVQGVPSYLTLSPLSGISKIGDTTRVQVHADRSTLQTGSTLCTLTVNVKNLSSAQVQVEVMNYTELKSDFKFNVLDAKFCSDLNQIVVLCNNPHQILLVDFSGTVTASIALPNLPLVLSNVIGTSVVVGSAAKLAVVNLQTRSVEKMLRTSTDPASIVLASNNWVYVSPQQDQWENLHCVDMVADTEGLVKYSMYAGSKIVYHPSGKYIYAITSGLSPQDLSKYDISKGLATYLYDSPYHGDYGMGFPLLMSADGSLIYTISGNAFQCTESKVNDMLYAGNIGLKYIHSFHENTSRSLLAVTYNTVLNGYDRDKSFLSILDNASYNVKWDQPLPMYYMRRTGGNGEFVFYQSFARFVFIDNSGTKGLAILNPFSSSSSYSAAPMSDWTLYPFTIK